MEDKSTFTLYDGEVVMDFKPNAQRYRYTVTDSRMGVVSEAVRGVTTCIGEVLDKPGLRNWPMNMCNGYIFGATWNEDDLSYHYVKEKAMIKPDTGYSSEELEDMLKTGMKQSTKRSDYGKDIGHLVHSSVEEFLKGTANPVALVTNKEQPTKPEQQDYDLPEQYQAALEKWQVEFKEWQANVKTVSKAFGAFKDWWKALNKAHTVEILGSEKPVYSRQLKYAGTYDLALKIDGKNYLLDVKTTNRGREAPMGIYPEMFLQLGAYSYATREEHGLQFDDVGIINVGKDGRLSLATAADLGLTTDQCERAFAFAVRIHDWLQATSKLTKDASFYSILDPTAPKVEAPLASN